MGLRGFRASVVCFFLLGSCSSVDDSLQCESLGEGVEDLSLLVADDLPGVWPSGMQALVLRKTQSIGPGAFNRDLLVIDEHTATQWDAPAHFIPPESSGLPNAGPMGAFTADKVPAWQFVGEACVLDVSAHVDDAAPGSSFLITRQMVQDWEKENRPLGPGDVFVFRSGFSDLYYKPFPAGHRYAYEPISGSAPAWPGPTPECVEYLAARGVWAAAIDSTSMGPLPDLGMATHVAGERHGLIWTEGATRLDRLPTTGSFYALLAPKYAGGSGGEARALAITEPNLAKRLVDSARQKQVLDLSVTMGPNYPVTWPGTGAGDEATSFQQMELHRFGKPRGPYFALAHVLDTQAGTHVVPPAFALPEPGFDDRRYGDTVRRALAKFERKYGARGYTTCTTEHIPLDALMGEPYVIDVRTLLSNRERVLSTPESPVITMEQVERHEETHGLVQPGQIVIFYTGYTDRFFKPFPAGNRFLADPLVGKGEGWPAPEPAVIEYLASRGVRSIGLDAPTFGGVTASPEVYWAAGRREVFLIENLTGVGELLGKDSFFIFAPIKLKGAHGGYGRAIALY